MSELERLFINPPSIAKPLTIWHWMNGVISREGITADLEAFKAAGLAGVQHFLVGGSEALIDDPSNMVLNSKWQDLFKFAVDECARLGLEFGTHNSPGWSSTGYKTVRPNQSMQKIVFSETKVQGPQTFKNEILKPQAVLNYYEDIAIYAVKGGEAVRLNEIIELSAYLSGNTLNWQVPEGNWTIVRLGHTTTGKVNGTAPLSGQGLEVDKLQPRPLNKFWEAYPKALIGIAGNQAGKSFKRFEVDSYEQGPQDWSVNFRQDFIKKLGYDPMPLLLTLTGRTVESKDHSARFKYDLKEMVRELFAANYYGEMQRLTHLVPGMELIIEPYATGHDQPFESNNVAAYGDLLMCEFWQKPTPWGWDSVKPTVSGAHTWGKTLVAAEAFTGQPNSAWKVDPYALKSTGDRAFANGVNKLFFHTSAHQPWKNVLPGMTMGQWGTHFGRPQTWWNYGGKEWISYLTRCQYLLQQGLPASDLCYLEYDRVTPPVIAGYECDTIGTDALLTRLSVKDNKLVLPNGVTYEVLVLPDTTKIRPGILQKIGQLVKDGAVVVGPKPKTSPGLQDFPACDNIIRSSADEIWGVDEQADRAYGKGHVYQQPVKDVLNLIGIKPDIDIRNHSGTSPLLWIHRLLPDAQHLYFLSNQEDIAVTSRISFRIKDMLPEFWHAVTGRTEKTMCWQANRGRVEVDLQLPPSGSIFVVFREKTGNRDSVKQLLAPPDSNPLMTLVKEENNQPYLVASENGTYQVEMISGKKRQITVTTLPSPIKLDKDWQLTFHHKQDNPEHIQLTSLVSWTELSGDLKYFSGTATYTKSFQMLTKGLNSSMRWFLDLGTVKNTANIKVNHRLVDLLWAPPFQCDITDFLKSGNNTLEIKVTNLWANRMIGDEQFADDLKWKGKLLAEVPEWVIKGEPRPNSKRKTFTTYKFFDKDSPIMESGLIGRIVLYPVLKKKI